MRDGLLLKAMLSGYLMNSKYERAYVQVEEATEI